VRQQHNIYTQKENPVQPACTPISSSTLNPLTPEQLQQLTSDTPLPISTNPPEPLTNPQAIALDAYGLDKKARRLEDCGKFARAVVCKNGHYHHIEISLCELKYCPDCGERLAEEKIRVWDPILSMAERVDGRLVYITIENPQATRSVECSTNISNVESTLRDEFYRIGAPALQGHFIGNPGWLGNNFITRILLVDMFVLNDGAPGVSSLPTDYWKNLFPGCKVAVNVEKLSYLKYCFKKLVRPLRIDSPEDRAEQEFLFHRKRQFRAVNVSLGNLDQFAAKSSNPEEITGEDCLSVEYTTDKDGSVAHESSTPVDSDTSNSPPGPSYIQHQAQSSQPARHYHHCRECKELADQYTAPVKVYSPAYYALKEKIMQSAALILGRSSPPNY
jgi:hypothetical protein